MEDEMRYTPEEIRLRDECAMRVLAAIIPQMPSPSAVASAMPVVFEIAETFLVQRRRRPLAIEEELTQGRIVS